MLVLSRHIGFVALNGALVSGACYFLWRRLPFLASEPGALLFWPMTVISLLAFALLYPFLRQQRGSLSRAAILYLAFVASLVSYGIYLWTTVRHGTAMMIPLALMAGHQFGLPVLAVIWFVNTALSPVLFGKPDIAK
jgi:hypothetical protein